jgi:hypothetical protein
LLLADDPEAAALLAAEEVEPGVFEATVPTSELTKTGGVTREWTADRP